MRCRRGMNHKSLGISNVGKVTRKAEIVNQLTRHLGTTPDTKGEHATKGIRSQELLGACVILMTWKTGV